MGDCKGWSLQGGGGYLYFALGDMRFPLLFTVPQSSYFNICKYRIWLRPLLHFCLFCATISIHCVPYLFLIVVRTLTTYPVYVFCCHVHCQDPDNGLVH